MRETSPAHIRLTSRNGPGKATKRDPSSIMLSNREKEECSQRHSLPFTSLPFPLLLPLHRTLQRTQPLLRNPNSIINLPPPHALALQPPSHFLLRQNLLPLIDLRSVHPLHPHAVLKPIPQLALLPTPKLLISSHAFRRAGEADSTSSRRARREEPAVHEKSEEDGDDDLGGEEGAEQGDEGVQRAAEGFEEAPVGFFGGDGCDALFARCTGLRGFFLALSLALASGRAAFAGCFC